MIATCTRMGRWLIVTASWDSTHWPQRLRNIRNKFLTPHDPLLVNCNLLHSPFPTYWPSLSIPIPPNRDKVRCTKQRFIVEYHKRWGFVKKTYKRVYNYKDIIAHYNTWQYTLSNDSYLLTHRVMSVGPVSSRSERYIHIRLSRTNTILQKIASM